MSATLICRYRLDDLRRFAAALGIASKLAPARALALASHLLWFDAAGAAFLGIGTLPRWLEAIETGQTDPGPLGVVTTERAALVILDGQKGLPPLLLERAGELAVEKARDTAVGLVRIANVGQIDSAAPVTAGIAIGPMAGFALGPKGVWSMALPSAQGLPLVFDSGLAATDGAGAPVTGASRATLSGGEAPSLPAPLYGFAQISEVMVPPGSWLVAAISIQALEAMASFQGRVTAFSQGARDNPYGLWPALWDAHRREAHEQGLAVAATAWEQLEQWAKRLAVEVPSPTQS